MKILNHILEQFRQKRFSITMYGITTFVSVLLSLIAFSSLPQLDPEPIQSRIDTIYIDRSITDSLLKDVLIEIHEINEKLKPKKVYIKTKPKLDTIRIDANVKILQ